MQMLRIFCWNATQRAESFLMQADHVHFLSGSSSSRGTTSSRSTLALTFALASRSMTFDVNPAFARSMREQQQDDKPAHLESRGLKVADRRRLELGRSYNCEARGLALAFHYGERKPRERATGLPLLPQKE
jgi:hypothetical protein